MGIPSLLSFVSKGYTIPMFSDPEKNIAQLSIEDGMHIADFGAGSGFYSFAAARKIGPRGKVYAIEVQRELLEKLKRGAAAAHLGNIEVVWGNIEKIGGTQLRDSVVDRVILSNVLFQVEHKDNLCLEIKRILKPNGKVLVIDWGSHSALGPKTLVPELAATAIFEKHGFVVETRFLAGDHHYGIILKKQ
jgi:ubiquinone/menaquinone biosynthesis C-methylase UbiE